MSIPGAVIQKLSEGQVYIEYGPIAMKAAAYDRGRPMDDVLQKLDLVLHDSLAEISEALPLLRNYPDQIPEHELSGLPLIMLQSVKETGCPTLTPMAAVAGTIADAAADWLQAQGATLAVADNGGDIALRLATGESIYLRIVKSLASGEMSDPVPVRAEEEIGGICTSGLGGRSFTRGIMESLTVFAGRASLADALATHLANCSSIDSDHVLTTTAGTLDPSSDIAELSITAAVDRLTEKEKARAFLQVRQEAVRLMDRGVYFRVQGWLQESQFLFFSDHSGR